MAAQLKVAQQESKDNAVRAQARPSRMSAVQTPASPDGAASLLDLQRTHGNRFVQRVLNGATIQRKCACGGTCAKCQSEGAQLEQGIVQHILQRKGSGQALEPDVRAFMETRFGEDFSGVRVHTDAHAAQTAQRLNAVAYTVGRDIFFGGGQHRPQTQGGRRLLAHELTHVVQQGRGVTLQNKIALQPANDAAEQESEQIAHQVVESIASSTPAHVRPTLKRGAPAIQRRLVVDDPIGTPTAAPPGETHEKIINDYLSILCPDFVATAGAVEPAAGFCLVGAMSATPESCDCLCEMHGLTTTWTIKVDDNDWPHTDDATHTVTVHSPFSGVEFGHWAVGPPAHRAPTPNWLVLGHELCGHALLMERGTHPTGPPPTHGGRPSHDVTVQIQNTIAAEHGIPASELRGLFADPHHGESFAKVTVAEFPSGSAAISALPASQRRQIDIAEAFIKSAPVKMDVVGHADKATASAAANLTTSRQRAENVKAALVGRGIGAGRFLVVNGVGDSECSLSGRQPSCRKVEIFMFIFEGASLSHP